MEKIIRVNMEDLTLKTEKCPDEYQLLGGRGLSARILNREVPALTHPLGSKNKLVVAPGLLAGTMAPSFGRISFGAKSPLTNTIKETNAGGTAAQKLDRLGDLSDTPCEDNRSIRCFPELYTLSCLCRGMPRLLRWIAARRGILCPSYQTTP